MEAVPQDPAPQNTKHLTLSVQKALRLLTTFSIERPELNLVELAHETGLNVSTAHRLLATLEAEGFVELNTVGTPILARLATETEDTTYLSVLSGDIVLCVGRVEGIRHSRSQFLAVGRHLPLHSGAASKVLLAHLPEDRVRQMLSRCTFVGYTHRTITDPEELIETLSQVRDQSYALSDEEITQGVTAIAAPIWDQNGHVISAISLSGAAERFGPDARASLIAQVREAGAQISVRLGYTPNLTL